MTQKEFRVFKKIMENILDDIATERLEMFWDFGKSIPKDIKKPLEFLQKLKMPKNKKG